MRMAKALSLVFLPIPRHIFYFYTGYFSNLELLYVQFSYLVYVPL